MTKKIILNIAAATVLSWLGVALVVWKLDPYESTELALIFFFIAFLFALCGSFTLLLSKIKQLQVKEDFGFHHIQISLRQGVILGLCTTVCLALLMLGLLRIWNGLTIVFVMSLIEFYFSRLDEFR